MTAPPSPPTGNLPTARLDVPSWTYHPEPPSAVDAALDRKTDRLFTTARVIQWSTAVVVLGVVLPAWLGFVELLPPVVLVVTSAVLVAASLVTALWHQQLRKHTGVPVVPMLEDILEPFASSMRSWQEAFEVTLEEGSTEDTRAWRELQVSARSALKSHHKVTRMLTRQFIIHGELAAQADRRGWHRLRDRHARTIAKLVLQATNHQPDPDTGDASGQDSSHAHGTDPRGSA